MADFEICCCDSIIKLLFALLIDTTKPFYYGLAEDTGLTDGTTG
jgi:hypothetical protein